MSMKRWAVFLVIYEGGKSVDYRFHGYLDDLDNEDGKTAAYFSPENGWAVVRLPDLDRPETASVVEVAIDRGLARAEALLGMTDAELAALGPVPVMEKPGRPGRV